MNRRAFITVLGGAAAWPLPARAQQPERMPRIGALIGGAAETDPESRGRVAALREGLAQRGWSEGHNIRIDYRWAGTDPDRIRAFAVELVATAPEAIFVNSTPATIGVLQATRSIPIVFATVSDPVGDGIVTSFARPGGNVTGFTNIEASMGGKWVEILKELTPSVMPWSFCSIRPRPPAADRIFCSRSRQPPGQSTCSRLRPQSRTWRASKTPWLRSPMGRTAGWS